MEYWIENRDNNKFTEVKTKVNDGIKTIGLIEKPYNKEEIYFVTGWNSETLSNDGNFIFHDFETAKQRIVDHYKGEMEVLKG
jgi:hypothetical protein